MSGRNRSSWDDLQKLFQKPTARFYKVRDRDLFIQIQNSRRTGLGFRTVSKNFLVEVSASCYLMPDQNFVHYFLPNPLASSSERRDISKYAGLSTDHIVSGISSHEIAIAIFPSFV
jgi:hypothetical protein